MLMVNITEKALDVLVMTLETSAPSEDHSFRLAQESEDEFGLTIDEVHSGDQMVKHGERTVLVMDDAAATALDGLTLDAVDSPEGVQFTLEEP